MDVQVCSASSDERGILEALVQLYVHDLSDLFGLDVGDDGRFHALSLEPCWSEPRCEAFLLRVEGKIAGFALVKGKSRLTGDEAVRDLAEFFVLRRYRRHGVGERAAAWLFDRFRGPWEVRQRTENHQATAFWRRAIGRYTAGRFEELTLEDERWRGPVQRFDSRATP